MMIVYLAVIPFEICQISRAVAKNSPEISQYLMRNIFLKKYTSPILPLHENTRELSTKLDQPILHGLRCEFH